MSVLFTDGGITQTDCGRTSDSVPLSIKHLFLWPAEKRTKNCNRLSPNFFSIAHTGAWFLNA